MSMRDMIRCRAIFRDSHAAIFFFAAILRCRLPPVDDDAMMPAMMLRVMYAATLARLITKARAYAYVELRQRAPTNYARVTLRAICCMLLASHRALLSPCADTARSHGDMLCHGV